MRLHPLLSLLGAWLLLSAIVLNALGSRLETTVMLATAGTGLYIWPSRNARLLVVALAVATLYLPASFALPVAPDSLPIHGLVARFLRLALVIIPPWMALELVLARRQNHPRPSRP